MRGGGFVGDQRAHQLDQRQHRDRIEEMQAKNPLRLLGGRGDLHDRDAGGIRRQHRVRIGDDPVELGEDLGLDGLVLDNGLDHQLPIG